jgi:hypothetical protein
MNTISSSTMADRQALFDGKREYSPARFDMILGHVVAQLVHCAALFSLADHLADRPAAAQTIARVEGLYGAATTRGTCVPGPLP